MARTRRNPPSLDTMLIIGGIAAVGVVGFLLTRKPRPVLDQNGVVIKAGYLPGISMSGANAGKTVHIHYAVGTKPQ